MPERGPLRFAVLELTNRCNLRCPHCASTSGIAREDELSLDEIRGLLRAVHALGGEEITVLGGEVFLRRDWAEVCGEVRALGMRLVLITNGLLLRSEETFARLRALEPYLVGVSIDGATKESYHRLRGADGFEQVLALLRRLLDAGFAHVNAITTFTRENLAEFDALADLFDGTGITWQVQVANKGGERFDTACFLTLQDYAWLVDKMREVWVGRRETLHLQYMDDFGYFPLEPKLRFLHQTWRGCIAGIELIGVRSNGDVLGCLSLADDAFVEANVRAVPLEEMWTSERFFQRLRRKEASLTGTCARCAFAARCRAGCSAMAWSATGGLGCDPYCIRSLETQRVLGEITLP